MEAGPDLGDRIGLNNRSRERDRQKPYLTKAEMTIPKGVSGTDFASALEGFERAVGREWLYTSDEDVALYRDAYLPFYGEPEAYRSGLIHVSGYEDLIPLVDALNLVTNSGLSNGLNGLRSPLLNARSVWNPDPGIGHVFYSPVIPKKGEEIFKAQQVFNNAFIRMGVAQD